MKDGTNITYQKFPLIRILPGDAHALILCNSTFHVMLCLFYFPKLLFRMGAVQCACTRIRSCLICQKKELYEPSQISSHDASDVPGLFILRDAITEEEENECISYFDGTLEKDDSAWKSSQRLKNGQINQEEEMLTEPTPGWKLSQSGRRKQDFGPKINFLKKKIKVDNSCRAVPPFLREILRRVSRSYADSKDRTLSVLDGFNPIEMVALEYEQNRGSHIEPHLDDVWAWGPRIVGISLLSDSHMLFIKKDNHGAEEVVKVSLPARSAYVMSGDSRYKWLHAISPSLVTSRRISLTFREMSDAVIKEHKDVCDRLYTLNRCAGDFCSLLSEL